MVEYNKKLRNTKQDINKIDEMIDLCDIKTNLLSKKDYSNVDSLLSLKKDELNNYNNIHYFLSNLYNHLSLGINPFFSCPKPLFQQILVFFLTNIQ